MVNTNIVIARKKVDIGTRVVLWDEKYGLNGYDTTRYVVKTENRKTGKIKTKIIKGKRYNSRSKIRKVDLNWCKKFVNQFFLHHSGLYRSRDTYGVLHKERGLSCHFIMDDDGTIYQTLDVKERAWHGGSCNTTSVGIEIDSRASATKFPTAYDKEHQKKYRVGPRKIRIDNIHNINIKGYDYSDGQYNALIKLTNGLCKELNINKDFPRGVDGKIVKGVIKSPTKFNGIMCHYHLTDNKIDPISLDYGKILKGIGGNTNYVPRVVKNTIDLKGWMGRQEALLELGHNPGPIDGIVGRGTVGAIKSFQSAMSLNPTGEWCQLTQTVAITMLTGLGIIVKI